MTRLRWKQLGWVCLLLGVCGRLTAADYESPLAAIELHDGDCLVFLGDSITHQCLYTQYVEDFFYTRFPQSRAQFHNAGVERIADHRQAARQLEDKIFELNQPPPRQFSLRRIAKGSQAGRN